MKKKHQVYPERYLNRNHEQKILCLQQIIKRMIFSQTTHSRRSAHHEKQVGEYIMNQNAILGQGSQATVYKGKHLNKKFQVAIKAIRDQWLTQHINRKLLDLEIQVLTALRGKPHVLNLLEVINEEEKIYIVTELCYGDLSSKTHQKLIEPQAWKYLRQLIKGYSQLHENQIVHRDLKPANLFLNARGDIKIGDFGFAITQAEAKKPTVYNIGSPQYMAPEALKKNQYSHLSDIWAIGMIFYQFMTGHRPFYNKTEEYIEEKLNQSFIDRLLKNNSLSQVSRQFLKSALQVHPSDRMSPQQLLNYLSPVKESRNFRPNKSEVIISVNLKNNPEKKPRVFERKNIVREIKPQRSSKFLGVKNIQLKQESNFLKKNKSMMQKLCFPERQKISELLMFGINVCDILFQILEKLKNHFLSRNFIKKHCAEEVNILILCYANLIINYLRKTCDLEVTHFLELPTGQLQQFLKSKQYKRISQVVEEKIELYSKTEELAEHWGKAKQQSIMITVNATNNLIKSISAHVKYFNMEEISLLRTLLVITKLLESLHSQKPDECLLKNSEKYLHPKTVKNNPDQQSFHDLIKRGKEISGAN